MPATSRRLVEDEMVPHLHIISLLGSLFTSDGCVSSAIKEHAMTKMCLLLKFDSIVNKNDIPFVVKRRVFEAALISSLRIVWV